MLQITTTIDIDAPVDDVWKKAAKLDDVQNFVDSVTKSYYSSEQKEGVGAERTCEVNGFGTLVEQIVDWKDGETFTYTVEGMPSIVKHAQSTWRLERENDFQTTVHTTISVETRYGVLGKMMETFALKPKMSATISSALAQFKQYVEKSQPEAQRSAAPLRAHAV